MSLDNTTSRIIEQVSQELLDGQGLVGLEVLDSHSVANTEGGEDFELPTPISNPFSFNPAHFLPNTEEMTLERFIEVAFELIQDAQSREGTVATEWVKLIEDYPAEEFHRLGDEVVAWKLISREPANMNSSAKGRPQRRGRASYKLRSPKHPNKWLEVRTRPLDHVIEFQCWSKSARLANRRAMWLENLFVNHAWAFKAQGADRFYFKRRTSDWYTTTGGQGLYVRPLQFFVRLHAFEVVADPVITKIAFEAGTLSASELKKGF